MTYDCVPAARQVPAYEAAEFAPKRHSYCVLVFVINEGEKLLKQLERMQFLADRADLVVADGGSTDGSTDHGKLAGLGVNTLLVKRGKGKLGSQMRMAFDWALKRHYEGVVVIDGNGKDGVEAIPFFLDALRSGADHIQGSRFIPGGYHENTPKSRYWGLKLLHLPVMRLASGFHYTDTTNGFRAYSAGLLNSPEVDLFRDEFEGYELHYYLAVKAARGPFKVLELPVSRVYPAHGKIPTKISPIRGNLNVIDKLLSVANGQYDRVRPVHYGWKLAVFAALLLCFAAIAGWGLLQRTSGDFETRCNEAGVMLSGIDPYFVWAKETVSQFRCDINAPWVYLAMTPFAKLSLGVAREVYLGLQFLLIGWIFFVLFDLARERQTVFTAALVAMAALVNPYYKTDLATGNFAILTAAGAALAIYSLKRNRETGTGIGFFLMLFKPTTGVLTGIPLLFGKHLKALVLAALLCGAATAAVWGITGSNPIELVRHMQAGGAKYLADDPHLSGIFAFLTRWYAPSGVVLESALFGLAMTLFFSWKLRKYPPELALLPALMMALLWNYSRVFNFVLLTFPAFLLIRRFAGAASWRERLELLFIYALLMFPIDDRVGAYLYSLKYLGVTLAFLYIYCRRDAFAESR